MSPERAKALMARPERACLDPGEFEDMCRAVIHDAKLREAATAVLSRLDYLQALWGAEGVTTRLADGLRAALDSKGVSA